MADLELEVGYTYVTKSGRKVTILQHIREGIVNDAVTNLFLTIPEHYVGSNQTRYHKNGMMYQRQGDKYDPIEAKFHRPGQKELDLILQNAQNLKKTLSVVESQASKLGLFFNYVLLKFN